MCPVCTMMATLQDANEVVRTGKAAKRNKKREEKADDWPLDVPSGRKMSRTGTGPASSRTDLCDTGKGQSMGSGSVKQANGSRWRCSRPLQGELSAVVQSVSESTRCPQIHRDQEVNWTSEAHGLSRSWTRSPPNAMGLKKTRRNVGCVKRQLATLPLSLHRPT